MYYLFIMRQVICWFVYIGKNPRFTAFLDSNLNTRLAIVTENELGLAFSPSYRDNKQTNRQTDKQTNAGDYIIPRESFHGDKNKCSPYSITERRVPELIPVLGSQP